ncbi:MAG: hypothetical protein VX265_17790 [Myxococcota bacterium]|nr:hypothetical protein [Myxococcota bacterium]
MAFEGGLLVAAASGGLLVRRFVSDRLDLRDLPGPGGVKIIAALTEGNFQRDRATEVIAGVLPWFSDAEAASRGVCMAGGVLAVLGATLAARGAGGRAAAVATAALAACWSQAVYVSILIGADSIAMGLAWLGAGLALVGPRLGWGGMAVVPLGLGLATLAIPIKVSAMPAVAVIAAAPFLVRPHRWKLGIGLGVILAACGLAARGVLMPGDAAHVGAVPTPSLAMVEMGWQRLQGLPDAHPEGLVLVQFAGVAAAGALLPGHGWAGRVVLGLVGFAALGFTAETVGTRLRPRFLTAAALPMLVLAGCAVGVATDLVRLAIKRILPRLHRASAALALLGLLAAIPVWQDMLGFHGAWAQYRLEQLGTQPARLPSAPPAWQHHYRKLGGLVFVDTSDQGALDLVRLGRDAPSGGAATVPLRDAREFHLRAGAGLAGKPTVILETRRCCRQGEDPGTCAARVVRELDAAGASLLVPVHVDRTLRVPRPHQSFWRALEAAAAAAGGLEPQGHWWKVRPPSGVGGGALPCGRNGR